MQSETDAAATLHKNPFVHNTPLHPCNSEGRMLLQPSWVFFSFLQTTFLLLTGFTLVAVVMEECHISL